MIQPVIGSEQTPSDTVQFVVVDDEVLIARDLAAQVRSLGYQVTGVFTSLRKANASIASDPPDIVLMDIHLGTGQDGIDAAERIYEDFGIPTVYVTAYSDESTLNRAQKTHPLGYILKPFQARDVKATLLMAVAQHKLSRSLEENRSWLHALLSSVPDAAIAIDTKGVVRFANRSAEEMLDSNEVAGRSLDEVLLLRDSTLQRIFPEQRFAPMEGLTKDRAILVGAKGQQVPVEYTLTNVPATRMSEKGQLLLVRDVSEVDRVDRLLARERDLLAGRIANADTELDRTKEELRKLSAELMSVQDAERRRIARDLHDDLAQQLTVLEMDTERIAHLTPAGGEASKQVARLSDALKRASDFVRNVSHRLHPSVLDHLGILPALRELAEDFRSNEDVPLRFRSNVSLLSLPAGIASGVYRITQEALRNVSKHAQGSAVAIIISAARKGLRVSIRDYGPGFDAADVRFNRGLGLISMQERARAMEGSLGIRSVVGSGTLVVLRVPLHDEWLTGSIAL